MNEFLSALVLFLPAGIANMSPVIANKIPYLKSWRAPMDFGKSWGGKRIFGENKTWRGPVFGAIAGAITALITYWINPALLTHFGAETATAGFAALAGAMLGVGALLGDAVESFFKRQAGIKPGSAWFPFDQIDYIIGALLFVWPLVDLTWQSIGYIFLAYFGLHLLVSYLGYLAGFKDKPI